jgi:hypothetical protein
METLDGRCLSHLDSIRQAAHASAARVFKTSHAAFLNCSYELPPFCATARDGVLEFPMTGLGVVEVVRDDAIPESKTIGCPREDRDRPIIEIQHL